MRYTKHPSVRTKKSRRKILWITLFVILGVLLLCQVIGRSTSRNTSDKGESAISQSDDENQGLAAPDSQLTGAAQTETQNAEGDQVLTETDTLPAERSMVSAQLDVQADAPLDEEQRPQSGLQPQQEASAQPVGSADAPPEVPTASVSEAVQPSEEHAAPAASVDSSRGADQNAPAAEPAPGKPCNPLAGPACALDDLQRLRVAPEHRCAPYDRDDYPYRQSVEDRIISSLGGIYGPYTGRRFADKYSTDIEHMIAVSEAHDSGLCRADTATRRRFSEDLMNLTLASPEVNRRAKRHYDAAEWLPDKNRCWFAGRVIAVRKKYRLTIDTRERQALERVLRQCTSLVLQK